MALDGLTFRGYDDKFTQVLIPGLHPVQIRPAPYRWTEICDGTKQYRVPLKTVTILIPGEKDALLCAVCDVKTYIEDLGRLNTDIIRSAIILKPFDVDYKAADDPAPKIKNLPVWPEYLEQRPDLEQATASE